MARPATFAAGMSDGELSNAAPGRGRRRVPPLPRLRTVMAVLLVGVVALAGQPPAGAAPARTGYERVLDITFPVIGQASFVDTYFAPRGGGSRVHQGTDIFGAKLQRIVAAQSGKVCYLDDGKSALSGYMLSICGSDGLRYSYIHLNNDSPGTDDGKGGARYAYAPGLRLGSDVARGDFIGYLGDSGNAETTPPHLHFQITDFALDDPRLDGPKLDPSRLNPYFSLLAAQSRGEVPGGAVAPRVPVERVAEGSTGTAVELSKVRPTQARTVILVPHDLPYPALLAAPLAGISSGVVLPVPDRGLSAGVRAEIARLGARNGYVVAPAGRLVSAERQLRRLGVSATARLGGANLFALAANVAAEIAAYPRVATDRVYVVATGSRPGSRAGWVDALTVSALAAFDHGPILLVTPDGVPAQTRRALSALQPEAVTFVGTAMPAPVRAAAAAAAGGAAQQRLAGKNRYAASARIARAQIRAGMSGRAVVIVSGQRWNEGLAAAPVAAAAGAPLVLVNGTHPGAARATEHWLTANAARFDRALVVGGTRSFSEGSVADLSARLNGR